MTNKIIAEHYPDALLWSFGDSSEMADELAQLVINGAKTATCCSYRAYKSEASPSVGDYNVILDGRGTPVCVIRTMSLTLVRYCDVTAEMAAKEGEGDKSLVYWQTGHRAFFEREGDFSPEMLLVFEQFKLVEVFATPAVRA
ncbi:ASCH domain-containing protein [Yersinia sp. 2466 StPb PI]|uniref:ASCH domain-containing protein n=1 Tax=unclassified Yersinia (in: enterobacteria) TaxID=2653513 RepID=UPI0009F27C33|nr:ASCH domain-containing protein [Yersinia enterocolitica]